MSKRREFWPDGDGQLKGSDNPYRFGENGSHSAARTLVVRLTAELRHPGSDETTRLISPVVDRVDEPLVAAYERQLRSGPAIASQMFPVVAEGEPVWSSGRQKILTKYRLVLGGCATRVLSGPFEPFDPRTTTLGVLEVVDVAKLDKARKRKAVEGIMARHALATSDDRQRLPVASRLSVRVLHRPVT